MTDRLVFKATDWDELEYEDGMQVFREDRERIARIAQAKFDAWLAAQREVFAQSPDTLSECWTYWRDKSDTHKARLVAIEALKPDEQREEA